MLKKYYNLNASDVGSLTELIRATTLGQNYRINFLWAGQRTDYVLAFLEQSGFKDLNDIKSFVDHFTFKHYLRQTRYQHDIDFRVLCDTYHDKNSSFLPVVLKKIETRSGYSTLWGKIAPRPGWRKSTIFSNRLMSWMFNPSELNVPEGQFRSTVRRLLSHRAPTTKPRLDSFEQFISLRTLWGTSGSTDVVIDKHVPKTKWQNALLMTDDEILKLVNDKKEKAPVYSIIDKSESNTVRAVILVDLVTYLIESYGSYYLDQILRNHPVFYNWKDESNRYRYWCSTVSALKQGEWFADYDWSGWDENLKDNLYQIVLSETLEVLDSYAPDYRQFEGYLSRAVKGAFLKGFKLRTTESGLASGRRWTTYINSVVNAAFLVMACENLGYDVLAFPDALVTLGDDSQTHLRPASLADSITDILNEFGARINKQKSKITNTDPEFLKFIATTSSITGVEIRAIRSIIWSTEEERNSIDNVDMRLDLWTKFLSRVKLTNGSMFDYDSVFQLFLKDLSNKTRLSIPKLLHICHTPTSLKGWGLLPAQKPYLGYEFTAPRIREMNPPKLKVPSIYGEFRSSIEALARQTLVRPVRETTGSYRVVKVQTRADAQKPIGAEKVTPLRPQHFITVDRNNVVSYATDQLWLSQATLDQVINYNNEPISRELRNSIHDLLVAWSQQVVFGEVSKSEVSSPPVQRVEILDKGEVTAGYFWSYVYSTFFLPFKTRRLDTGSLRTLLFSAQYTASHTGLILGDGLGTIVEH